LDENTNAIKLTNTFMVNSNKIPKVTSNHLPFYNIILNNGYQHSIVADRITEDDEFHYFFCEDQTVPFTQFRKDQIVWKELTDPSLNMFVG